MRWKSRALAAVLVLLAAANSKAEVLVSFDYSTDTTDFFSDGSPERATLEAAGSFYQSILDDDLLGITPGGVNYWSAEFTHPATGNPLYSVPGLVVPANTLTVFVGARDLGGNVLGQAGPGGWLGGGTQDWINLLWGRGEGDGFQGSVAGSAAYEFGPWGGAMAIDIDSNWNLDHVTEPTTGEADLYSVILHELGHIFGLGTAHSWDNLIVAGEFTGIRSVAEFGNNVPLHTDDVHWAEGTPSNIFPAGASQEAAMDPTILLGTRKLFTDLDVAALDDIGWDAAAVPEPSSIVLLSSAAIVFFAGAARRRRKQKP